MYELSSVTLPLSSATLPLSSATLRQLLVA